jgi:hypothetical protein
VPNIIFHWFLEGPLAEYLRFVIGELGEVKQLKLKTKALSYLSRTKLHSGGKLTTNS